MRRSRERIKEGDKSAKKTLYFVLKNLAKLMAPFAPFSAEDIWLRLKNVDDAESVHLAEWPKISKSIFDIFGHGDKKVLEDMQKVREGVSILLKERQQNNIPVRQPLAQATGPSFPDTYVEILKDELNVKGYKVTDSFGLDTNITSELKLEGNYRELARALQDMRKKMELKPSDVISITFETNEAGKKLVQKFEADMKKNIVVSKIEFSENGGEEVKIDDLIFKVKIAK